MKVSLVLSGACIIALAMVYQWLMGAPADPPSVPLAPEDPEMPRVFLNTDYVMPTGRTITVNEGGNLQSALNRAQPGDVIMIQAGATFTGNFVLPAKSGSGWITVRTSTSDKNLPQGRRVTPASASLMPRIVTPNSGPALEADSGAHQYRLIGL